MADSDMIKPLHGLRGIAAMSVIIGHFSPVASAASLGVLLFFVLSGFLIGKLYLPRAFDMAAVRDYAVARVARIYPLFALVVIVTALINIAVPDANIFGLRPELVADHLGLAGSASTLWTISTEFQFYALFIPIWYVMRRSPYPRLMLAMACMTAFLGALWLGTGAGRIGLFGYLHIFLLGLCIAVWNRESNGPAESMGRAILPLALLGYALVFLIAPGVYFIRWVYIDPVAIAICAALIHAGVTARSGAAVRLLSHRYFVWLGEVSFGAYLLHRHAEWIVTEYIAAGQLWATLPLKIALTLIFAGIANWLVERPARQSIRQVFASRKAAQSLTA